MSGAREGGCFCGDVRYHVTAAPGPIVHCHCTDCRGTTGAAFVSWVGFPLEAFAWVAGEPTIYTHASDTAERVERSFCPRCGTALTFHRPGEARIDATVASLDDSAGLVPEEHIFTASAVDWLEVNDGLPRRPGLR